MNILMALSQLEVTGAEVYATSIGDRLSADGHSVFYVSDTLSTPHRGQYLKLRFNKRSLPRRLWHIAYLIYLIKRHKIQIVHAHSRASGWSAYIACKLTNTPMVTTVHGRQPVHASRKKFHALGYKAFAVCENIKQQIETALGVPAEQVKVIRNGINTDQFSPLPVVSAESKPIIVIIGRLTGPKGEVVFRLLEQTIDLTCYQVKIYSGSKIDSRFDQFRNQVQFCGHSNNVREAMRDACLVIGGGRVAIEALLCEKTTLAIGEAFAIGIVNENNLPQALESNFGDIGEKELDINFLELKKELEDGLVSHHDRAVLRQRIESEYHLDKIVDQILVEYQSAICHTKRKEVPIIMYHRVINNDDGIGVHGTYIKLKNLDKHFKLIKKMGFETITFKDLERIGLNKRFDKRYIMLTFDDGYQDNYDLLLPLLEKYQFKATIYVVTGESHNRWDHAVLDNPDKRFELLDIDSLKKLAQSPLIEIGGHTLTHPRLNQLTEDQQREEIISNKERLEEIINQPVTTFAYPYGDHNEVSKKIVSEAGYQYTVATNSGPKAIHEDLNQIRRIAIFPKTDTFGLWRKIRGNYTFRKK